MVTGPIPQPSTVAAVARPPAASLPWPTLPGAVPALVRALDGPGGESHWRERLIQHLDPVRQGFAEHVRLTEGPTGLYAEVLCEAPRLTRGVRRLTREHAFIVTALAALHHAAALPEVPAEELRARVGELLRALRRHRQRGADLLWEAYQADLGGED
ncbi:hemerythrin domain-containing protein [Micromonospora sp. NPDC050495]|uniref:hemerythrin domain-containing protein n=1 Tax=Micromonospora sp. NPDC050495 TaxID=3154936 RepID=UPI0033EC888C